ncbi:DUF1189 family protein [Peribacillus sp. SCS-26]|uniref:DUF1189 family protein n=1 Tax=Paraperibacillus marinus TaxID=3115295 RepID=UPI003906150B
MMLLKDFTRNRFSLGAVSQLGKKKWYKIILQNILIGTLIAFPLVIQVLKADETRLYEAAFPELSKSDSWYEQISGIKIVDGLLSEKIGKLKAEAGKEYIAADPDASFENAGREDSFILFTKEVLVVNSYGIQLKIPYGSSDMVDFDAARYKDGEGVLKEIAAVSKPHLAIPAMQFIYPLSFLLNIIFIALISLFALPMNYRLRDRRSYREIFTMFSYAATIPAIAAFVIGSLASAAFVYTIYNFGLIFIGYYLFRKHLR